MEWLFSTSAWWLWGFALATALFFPVRHFVFVMYIRSHRRRNAGAAPEGEELGKLRKRAIVTAALICYVFSAFYAWRFFGGVS